MIQDFCNQDVIQISTYVVEPILICTKMPSNVEKERNSLIRPLSSRQFK